MKQVIYNNFIPFKGFKAITLWPFIFVRNSAKERYYETTDRHEHIHLRQQSEMLAVAFVLVAMLADVGCGLWSALAAPIFYWWYIIEWLVRWAIHRDANLAYKNISFEREAEKHEHDKEYLFYRKPFVWVKYLMQ